MPPLSLLYNLVMKLAAHLDEIRDRYLAGESSESIAVRFKASKEAVCSRL
jgi:hypothetical protein